MLSSVRRALQAGSAMNILHVLHEFPLPPTSGIRCDMARRLDAFRALGHHVFVICWASVSAGEMPTAEQQAALGTLADEAVILQIGADRAGRLRRVWNLRRHPSYVAARIPDRASYGALLPRIEKFAPDLVWLEGVHPSWLALDVSRRLGIPLAYRSHNVEYRYVAEQAHLARSPRLKLALAAGTWGLEATERLLHAQATRVFDISTDDLAYWRAEGFTNGVWLATQPDTAILATSEAPDADRDIDLLFLGSLSSPNNIAGLRWFFEAVYPLITDELPNVQLVVAGRKPPLELVTLVKTAGARVIADPPEVAPLFSRARVMFNPILHGSGVNIKTIDMLATGRTVVTTTKGARGLPTDVIAELAVADQPEAFAKATIAAVHAARAGAVGRDRGALIERVFGIDAVAAALARFERKIPA